MLRQPLQWRQGPPARPASPPWPAACRDDRLVVGQPPARRAPGACEWVGILL